MGEVFCTIFTDLNNKKRFDGFDVDTNSLKPISLLLKNKKRMMRRKVVKNYKRYSGMRKEYLMPKKLVLELDYKRKKEME